MGHTLKSFIIFLIDLGFEPEANAIRLIFTAVGEDISLNYVRASLLADVIHFLSMRYKPFDRMVEIVTAAKSAMDIAKTRGFVVSNPFDEILDPERFVKEHSDGKE